MTNNTIPEVPEAEKIMTPQAYALKMRATLAKAEQMAKMYRYRLDGLDHSRRRNDGFSRSPNQLFPPEATRPIR